MKQQVVSLGIVGKESQFPFTGIFSAQQEISIGKVSAVGRIHDADIKRVSAQSIWKGCFKRIKVQSRRCFEVFGIGIMIQNPTVKLLV